VGVLNAHNLVARVINPFQVGRGQEIKGKLQFIVGGIELDQMLDRPKQL